MNGEVVLFKTKLAIYLALGLAWIQFAPGLARAGTALATSTTLSVSAGSVSVGTAVLFTAAVKDQNRVAVTSGLVKFCNATAIYCEDVAVLSAAQLTSAGTATLNLRLGPGSHSIKAVFVGTLADAPSASGSQNVAVSGVLPSTTLLAASGVQGNYTLSATVSGGGSKAPTGTVTLEDASNGNATVAVAMLDPTTAVATFQGATYGRGWIPQSVAVGDFNGDGKPDLVTACGSDVVEYLGNGDGTFQAPVSYPTGDSEFVTVGDVNGDGKFDLVVPNPNDNTVGVLLGNGDGTFQAEQTFAAGNFPVSVAVGDFNGDGKPDLVVANQNDWTVGVLLGNGDGTFQAQQTYATGLTPYSVAVADFNASGRPGLATANFNDDTVSVLLSQWEVQAAAANVFVVGGAATHPVFAAYSGDSVYASSSSSTAVNLISGIPTSLGLNVTPGTSVQLGETVLLDAGLFPATYNGVAATGTVTFYDAGTPISAAEALNVHGQKVLTVGTPNIGNHSYSAVYSGDGTFSAATSATVVVCGSASPLYECGFQ